MNETATETGGGGGGGGEVSAAGAGPAAGAGGRGVTMLRWGSVGVIVVALFWMMSLLPIRAALAASEGWIVSLGWAGVAAYGALYTLATVLLVPGAPLTLMAGAIFGPLWGLVSVSFGSTVGVAFAFLIARYLARDKVAAKVKGDRRFNAIDRAIGEGGWKIVAMLRMSPAVPFNLQNYLYGLTAIRFWPCVLASWIAMLPGTFLYVYIGYAGREAAEAAASGSVQWGRWALMGVGLLATVIVTIYITRLAQRELAKQTEVVEEAQEGEAAEAASAAGAEAGKAAGGAPWKTWGLAAVAALMLAGAIGLHMNREAVRGRLAAMFGPPPVEMREAYPGEGGARFDHGAFDTLLARHVDARGMVDYEAFARDREALQAYIERIGEVDFEVLSRDEKLALLLNAYNAFTIELILEHLDEGITSIKDIPEPRRWDDVRWRIGGEVYSLNAIEHEQIRPNFKEPRIHFALVCAAIGCPPLRSEAYRGALLEMQLEDQAAYVHAHPRWFERQGPEAVRLTQLYQWYRGDFEQVAGSLLAYVARYRPEVAEQLEAGEAPRLGWLDYDWTLNGVRYADRLPSLEAAPDRSF